MNAIYGGDLSVEEQQRVMEAQQAEREELVAQCMTEEGFEYVPATSSGTVMSEGSEWEPDEREWVAQYGYGMVDFPGRDEPVAPAEEFVDPNADYVASLSESEQAAFYEALYGPQPSEGEMAEDGSYEYDWESAGCSGWAEHETAVEDPARSDEFAPLMESINTFYTDMASRPEFAGIEREWSSCMSDAGYSFSTQAEAQQSISDQLSAYYEANAEGSDTSSPEVQAIADEEIEVALADLDCRERTNYREHYAEVQKAAEAEFVAQHKVELDRLRAAAEQSRS